MIRFGEYLPDISPLNNPGSPRAVNVLPIAEGFGPMPSVEAYSDALTGQCLGAFSARSAADAVYVYAGEDNGSSTAKLRSLSAGSWVDVTRSSGGDYTHAATSRWEFAQWNEQVVATNYSDDVQVITLGGGNFAALGGSPPKARHLCVARNFLILGNINDGAAKPDTLIWSALGDITDWTQDAVTQSDSEDLPNGGYIQRLFGGEYAVVLQERSIRRMTYVGAPAIWQIDEISPSLGLIAPGMAAQAVDLIFFLSERGFTVCKAGAQFEAIGANKVDSFVLNDIDTDNLHRCTSVADDKTHRVFFAYPGRGNVSGLPNRLVVYDWSLNRWSYSEQDTQTILRAATTSYDLDTLDTFSTDIDAISPSFDDPAWTGGRYQIAKFDADAKLGFFTGSAMAATIETSQGQLAPGRRSLVSSVTPIVEGGTTTVQIGHRDTPAETLMWTPVSSVNSNGRATRRKNARYHQFRLNLTGDWTAAHGVDVSSTPVGQR